MSSENAAKLLDKMVQRDTTMVSEMALKGFVGLTVNSRDREKNDDDLQKPGCYKRWWEEVDNVCVLAYYIHITQARAQEMCYCLSPTRIIHNLPHHTAHDLISGRYRKEDDEAPDKSAGENGYACLLSHIVCVSQPRLT